ncbi:MAG: hypothetical protein WCD81_11505 [Candidatus Bathyarchaeia archaeon]
MAHPLRWTLFYHRETSRPLAEFLRDNTKLKQYGDDVVIHALPNTNSNPQFGLLPYGVRRLLFFGHPDVILSYYDGIQPERAVFAWEITDAKPATDHWMQRFTSLVGACETGVPSVFILRFETITDAWSSKIKSEFFYAYNRVMDIHRIPIYIANWQSDSAGRLQEDPQYPGIPDRRSTPMVDSIAFFEMVMEYTVHGRDFRNLPQERLIVELRDKLVVQISQIPKPSDYERLCVADRNGIVDTSSALDYIKGKVKRELPEIPERIKNRRKSLVFVPRPQILSRRRRNPKESLLGRIQKRNGNPYNGMPLAFDFMFCRLGITPRERDVNLIIDLSELSFADFASFHKSIHDASPLGSISQPSRRILPKYSLHLTQGYSHELKDFIRQYCYAADILVFKDFVVPFY